MKIFVALAFWFNNSPIRRANQMPWQAAVEPAVYSASHEERATTRCFWDCQLVGLRPRNNDTPKVLFLSSRSTTMSGSLKPTSFKLSPR